MKFDQFAQWLANHSGRPLTFVIALMLIIAWGVSGPLFHFNDTGSWSSIRRPRSSRS
jgi:low affinity Fe/Cu permease